MNENEINILKVLFGKFIKEYIQPISDIESIEYNVDNQQFYVKYKS